MGLGVFYVAHLWDTHTRKKKNNKKKKTEGKLTLLTATSR